MKTRSRRSESAPLLVESSPKQVAKATPKKPNANALVADILDEIKVTNAKASTTDNETAVEENVSKPKKLAKAVRGIAKSGRPWKEVKKKFHTIKKTVHRRTFEKKELFRDELKHIKELSKSIKEDKKQENIAKKQRREENAQRRLENERKSEVVQVIKNTAKMKRMKKKALRKVEKRDLSTANGPKVV